MTGEEERLYARAEMLAETEELARAAAKVLEGAQGGASTPARSSPDRRLLTLDLGAAVTYSAGAEGPADGTGYGSDGEFLEACPTPRTNSRCASAK